MTLLRDVLMNQEPGAAGGTATVGQPQTRTLSGEPLDPAERLAARWASEPEPIVGEPEGEEMLGEEAEYEDIPDGDEGQDGQDQDGPDGDEEADGDADDGDVFRTLDELLEAGQANPADLALRVKVAGEERDVTLEEAIRGYQRQADYDRHMQEVREQRETLRAEREDVTKQVTERVQQLDSAIGFVEQQANAELEQLQREYQAVDWNTLRADDPEEYAARMADFQRMEQGIRQRAGTQLQQMQRVREDSAQALQEAQSRYYQEQGQALRKLPGWVDEAEAKSNLDRVFGYLSESYGVSQDELQKLSDHRIFDLARKAALYDELQKTGQQQLTRERDPETGQFVRAKQKRRLRPGGSQGPGAVTRQQSTKQEQQLRQRLKGSGSMDDASAVLAHRFSRQQSR